MNEAFFTRFLGSLQNWASMDHIISRTGRVVMVGLIILLAIRMTRAIELGFLTLAQNRFDHSSNEHLERDKRIATVLRVIGTTLRVNIGLFGVFMVMRELGFDITPLLTGAGIAGVAVGFGSQSLVKDIIAGVFLLLENQIRIGDVIRISGLSGTVERMELRVTVLRDVDGTLHIIPNGEIKAVSNMTYQWSRAVVDLPLAYQADVPAALNILTSEFNRLYSQNEFRQLLLEAPVISGITEFSNQDLKLRITAKTGPHDRVAAQNKMRLASKQILDAANIPWIGTIAPQDS